MLTVTLWVVQVVCCAGALVVLELCCAICCAGALVVLERLPSLCLHHRIYNIVSRRLIWAGLKTCKPGGHTCKGRLAGICLSSLERSIFRKLCACVSFQDPLLLFRPLATSIGTHTHPAPVQSRRHLYVFSDAFVAANNGPSSSSQS
jgi:hypothetical protein